MFKQLQSRNKILLFWGGMDLLALLLYIGGAMLQGHVPFYSEFAGFFIVLSNFDADGSIGILLQTIFIAGVLMKISLVFSAYMFLFKEKLNFILLSLQEILRFVSFSCSVSFFPLFLYFSDSPRFAVLPLAGFMLSECGKIGSLWWYRCHITK